MNTFPDTDDLLKEQVFHESTIRTVHDFDCIGIKQIAIIPNNDKSYRKVARNVFQSLHNLGQSSRLTDKRYKTSAPNPVSIAQNGNDVENTEKGLDTCVDDKEDFGKVDPCNVYSPIKVKTARNLLFNSNVTKLPKKRKVEQVTNGQSSKKTSYRRNINVMSSLFNEIAQVTLDDERVFDSCDEVRSKISNFIEEHTTCKKMLISNLNLHGITFNNFMKSSKQEQCHSVAYKNAYIFFEKLRIYQGKEKSESRLNNELLLPHGFSLKKEKKSLASSTAATGEMC